MPRLLSGRRRGIFIRLLLLALAQAGGAVALARVLRFGVDAAHSADRTALLPPLSGALLLLPLIAWLRWSERLQAERLAQSYLHRLRRTMFERLSDIDAGGAQKVHRGAVLLRFIGDLSSVGMWISGGVAQLAAALVLAGVTLAALALDDWRLALIDAAVLLAGGVTMRIAGGRLYQTMADVRRHSARLANHVAEKTQALPLARAFASGARDQRRLDRRSARVRNARIQRARFSGLLAAIADATGALLVVATLAAGVALLRPDASGVGVLVSAITIVSLLAAPLRNAARAYDYWCRYRLSRHRIQQFLRDGRRHRGAPPAVAPDTAVFGVSASDPILEARGLQCEGRLARLDLAVPARARVVVTGSAGAGKSSLLAVLAGWLEPDAGELLLAGHPGSAWSLRDRQRLVGAYSADLPLVSGSALRNLLYRQPGASAAEIAAATELFDLRPLLQVAGRVRGRRLIESGHNLSTSERQRLMLARAWIGAPRLLLLDDVDAISDAGLRACLRRAIAAFDGAIIMVSESADLSALADQHWQVANGGVVTQLPCPAAVAPRSPRPLPVLVHAQ